MTHFGLLCPPVAGHLNPICALARGLISRGHRVTLFGPTDLLPMVENYGGEFCPWGADFLPPGEMQRKMSAYSQLRGPKAIMASMRLAKEEIRAMPQDVVPYCRSQKVDALIVDKTTVIGGSIAQALDIPFITFMGSLFPELSPEIPPVVFGWSHRRTKWAHCRNRFGNFLVRRFTNPLFKTINQYRREANLAPLQHHKDILSPALQLSQLPHQLMLPRSHTPITHAGPLIDGQFCHAERPGTEVIGRDFILVTLGTLTNRTSAISQKIAKATAGLGCKVVMVTNDSIHGDHVTTVPFVNQWELLAKAKLLICHGGLNSSLEALCRGLPVGAIPQTQDQPGVVTRLEYHNVGKRISVRASVPDMKEAIQTLLEDNNIKSRAKAMGENLNPARSVASATDSILKAI